MDRKQWKIIILMVVVFLLAVGGLLKPELVYACSCMAPSPPDEALNDATAVFTGQVIDINGSYDVGNQRDVAVTFIVSEVWKGPVEPEIVIQTASSTAACGVYFEPGDEYLIYAFDEGGNLWVNACSRTANLEWVDALEFRALGESSKPSGPTANEQTGYRTGLLALGGGALLGLLGAIVVLGVILFSRRRAQGESEA